MGKGWMGDTPDGEKGKVPPAEAAAPTSLQKCSSVVANKLSGFFDKLGGLAAVHPWKVILVSVLLCLACMSGFSVMESESRADKLWVPQDTIGQSQSKFMRDTYGSAPRKEELVAVAATAGTALGKPMLLELMRMYEEMLLVTAENGETAAGTVFTAEEAAEHGAKMTPPQTLTPAEYKMSTLCMMRGGSCWSLSILSLWCHDRAALTSDTDVLATINRYSTESYSPNLGAGCAPAPLKIADVVGGLAHNGAGQVISGDALYGLYWVQNNGKTENGRKVDRPAEAFEDKLLDMLETFSSNTFVLSYQTTRSRSDAFGGAIAGDISLVSSGYFLIIGYAVFSFGRCSAVQSRALLTLAAVVAVGLAIGASMGLASLMGQFYGPVHSVLPFLLLGLGIDDAFVIANQFGLECGEHLAPGTPERKRLAERSLEVQMRAAMKHAGVSVTVTSVTDMVAFAIGTSTALPALSSFCVYAACGILLLYVLMSTFFAAAVGLDARRQRSGRRECCCCCKSKKFVQAAEDQGFELAIPGPPAADPAAEEPKVPYAGGPMRQYFEKVHAPMLMKMPVQVGIVVAFLGMLIVGAYGATQLEMDFRYEWFYPDDSYLQNFIRDRENHFVQMSDFPVQLVFDTPISYSAHKDDLLALQASVATIPELDGVTVVSWYSEYVAFNSTTPAHEAEFTSHVAGWLAGAGAKHKKDVIITAAGGEASIVSSRMHYKYDSAQMVSATDKVVCMKALQKNVGQIIPAVSGVSAFPFTYAHVFFEQYEVIDREMWVNLGLALLAVLLITFLLIGHPGTSLLVFAAVAMTLVDVLGMMWLWGVSIDSVAVINLTLAIGLAVDYSAHIGHNFMVQQGTRPERVTKTLADMGTSVFNGGFSTFLAVVVLAISKSYVFRVFFKMFFGISLFGLAHGLILLPVALALIGPDPYLIAEQSEIADRPATPSSVKVKEPSKQTAEELP